MSHLIDPGSLFVQWLLSVVTMGGEAVSTLNSQQEGAGFESPGVPGFPPLPLSPTVQ